MHEMLFFTRHTSSSDFLVIVGLLLVAVGTSFYYFVKNRKLALIISDTPTSKIRSASQGYVEIKGVIQPLSEPLIAPLTKKPCCWYSYVIEEKQIQRIGNRNDVEWVVIDHHSSHHFFYLKDETGLLAVYPLGAEVMTSIKDRWFDSTLTPAAALLGQSVFEKLRFTLSGTSYRFTERRLEVGQSLVALGFFHTFQLEESPFSLPWVKDNHNDVINKKKKKLSKHPKLAQIADLLTLNLSDKSDSKKEWRQVCEGAQQSAKDKSVVNLLHKKERPMILSNFSESRLVGKYKWLSFFSGLGFIVSLALLTLALLGKLH